MKQLLFTAAFLLCAGGAFAQLDRLEDNSRLPMKIFFKPGTATLNDSSVRMLAFLRDYLARDTSWTLFRIEGHVTGEADNMGLSKARAIVVVKWLVDHGIDCKRLIAVGFADQKQIFPAGDPRNTRIDYVNVEKNHKPVNGKPADGGGEKAGDPCK